MKTITVNTKDGEVEYKLPKERGIKEAIKEVIKHHPSWTSMVIVIVRED